MYINDLVKNRDVNNICKLNDIAKYSKTLEFRKKLYRSLDVLDTFLKNKDNPILSCGGGKDGTAICLLSLMLGVKPTVLCANPPNPLPDREEHKRNLRNFLGFKWIDVSYDWDCESVLRGEKEYPAKLKMDKLSKYQQENNIDGVVFGIRALESNARTINLKKNGYIYSTKNGDRCQPIANWSAYDSICLALILDAPVNPVYYKMDGCGDLERLHDGTWWHHGIESRAWWFKRYYPDYYELYQQSFFIGDKKNIQCSY